MKALFAFGFFFAICLALVAQPTRIAIIDFENISGIAKYDGLGKAMSSMLISDIEANVSPKRLQLVERAQIQKVIKEQNFQASGSVDKATAVKAGKILGVTYMLVGDVYVLNEQLIINARLTNTETGDIVFSKKQEGKTTAWLPLKTAIAQDIASSLAMPFTEPTIQDSELAIGTITTFGNAIAASDQGNIDKAQSLADAVTDINPEFAYVDDLRKEIEKLKQQVAQNTADIKVIQEEVIENTTDYLELGTRYFSNEDYEKAAKYLEIGVEKTDKFNLPDLLSIYLNLSKLYNFHLNSYEKALHYSNEGLMIYPYFKEFIIQKYYALAQLKKHDEFKEILTLCNNSKTLSEPIIGKPYVCDTLLQYYVKNYCSKNNLDYTEVRKWTNNINYQDISFFSKGIYKTKSEYFFDIDYASMSIFEVCTRTIFECYHDSDSLVYLL
jgi:TolB-like protein